MLLQGEHASEQEEAPPGAGAEGARQRRLLAGMGVSLGIAIGPACAYARPALSIEPRTLDEGAVEDEVARFEDAVARAEKDLDKIIGLTREKLGAESAGIFEAQRLMLRDEAVLEATRERIRTERSNAAYALEQVMQAHRRRMTSAETAYMRERASDLLDVQNRIVRHLRRGKLLAQIPQGTIVVAEHLTAADLILFSRRGIEGCAIAEGGATSHEAIMARALGVPTVTGVQGLMEAVEEGDPLVLDGGQGRVLVHPSAEDERRYRRAQERHRARRARHRELAPLPAETRDGHRITLRANVEFSQEVGLLDENGAEGIGLFRTEMLLLMRGQAEVTEDAKYQTYKEVVEAVRPALTTLRLLDLGGDKLLPLAHREANPFLGWRGLRVLLDKPEILQAQLRAILRASAHGPVRILLPMVTNLGEVRRFRTALAAAQESLAEEGHAFDAEVPVGIMVEVPAVALLAEAFAAEADFFSIGTNDLTQYTLAVDRGNDRVASTFSEFHPAVLALIQRAAQAARAAGIPVSLCGEMAAETRAAPLLIGLGVEELSASPAYLPDLKRTIRAIRYADAEALARAALAAPGPEAAERLVDEWLAAHAEEDAEAAAHAAPSAEAPPA